MDRRALPDDAAALAQLRVMMQSEIKGAAPDDQRDRALRTMCDYFTKGLSDRSFIAMVALRDGQIVSTNGIAFYQKPPSLYGGAGLVGYVTNVYTLPDWRGKGIASSLFRQLLEEAAAYHPDKLHLGATDMGEKIYQRCGFKAPASPQLEIRFVL